MRYRSWIYGVVCVLVCGGCQPSGGKKNRGDELHIGFHFSSYNPSFNVYLDTSAVEGTVEGLVYSTLFDPESRSELTPVLVRSWKANEDKTEWSLSLKEGVLFHDGHELKAADVVYSFRQVLREKNSFFHSLVVNIRDVGVTREGDVVFTLEKPDTFFQEALKVLPIVREGDLEKNPIVHNGTGPFREAGFNATQSVLTLAANKKYFDGPPALNAVVFNLLPNQMSSIANLLTHKADLIYLSDPSYEKTFLSNRQYRTVYQSPYYYYFMEFNPDSPLTRSPGVRMALNYALSKEAILESLKPVINEAGLLKSFTPLSDARALYFEYSPEKALTLLKQEGFSLRDNILIDRDGKAFMLHVISAEEHELNSIILAHVRRQLRQIGIEIEVKQLPYSEVVKRRESQKDYDLLFCGVSMRFKNLVSYNLWHSPPPGSLNSSRGYRNPDADRYLDELRYLSTPETKNQIFLKFENALRENPPAIFLFWRKIPVIVDKRFQGVPSNPWDISLHFDEFWVRGPEQKYH